MKTQKRNYEDKSFGLNKNRSTEQIWKTSELTKKARLIEGMKSYPWDIVNVKNTCVNSPNIRISKL